ncbi:ABC transporter permease subunit [Dactylosporangium sp. CA-092794]|uniref:ABC transporter permease subunit n=1 Tax=Dactylosporangium sp. CA-092794 TaxID=3239929 RepID=UPI003D8D04AA
MTEHLSILVLAAAPGAMIGLLAMGLITVHRSSGVLYLAQPTVATAGGFLFVEFSQRIEPLAAVIVASALTGALSVLIRFIVMKPLQNAASLTKLVASIGVSEILAGVLLIRYGPTVYPAVPVLPQGSVELPFGIAAGIDRLLLLAIAVAVTGILWAVYRYTRFGLQTNAIAESPFFAGLFGLRSGRLATLNWLIAGVLAGFAGSILTSVNGISATQLTGLIIPILAAAVIGQMSSFPLAMIGAIGIAFLQAEASNQTSTPGAADLAPFVILLAVLMIQGDKSVMRNFTAPRLPALGSGRVRWVTAAIISGVVLASIYTWISPTLLHALLTNFAVAIILLSIVVITGFAGQLPLSNMVIAGFGAFCAANVAAKWAWPFPAALLLGVVVAGALSGLQAIPAMRLKPVNFAVVSLAFGVFMSSAVLLSTEGIAVPAPTVFGFDVGIIRHPENYAAFVFVILVLVMIAVTNLRRSRSGLRMITVRGNERVASSIGIKVYWTKAVAFVISGAVAGLGGVLMAYQAIWQSFEAFTPWGSAQLISWATVGGVALTPGPVLGSSLAPGSLGTLVGTAVYDDAAILAAVGGVLLILTLMVHPDGAANLVSQVRERVRRRRAPVALIAGTPRSESVEHQKAPLMRAEGDRHTGRTLHVSGISVNFGKVQALTDVSFHVRPGTIHGLIGSNGSGKTTLLDIISGFTKPSSGQIRLGDQPIDHMPAWRRARLGVGRSFQNGQLLSDFNVRENILITGVATGGWAVVDLVAPRTPKLGSTGLAVARKLELDEVLDARIDSLTHGRRQMVSIARALSAAPALVLLDEPAAGLDDTERQELRDLLRQLASELNIGILLVEHDVALVLEVCDIVTVLDGGCVIAEGPPSSIRESAAVRAAYLGEELAAAEARVEGVGGVSS